MRTLQAQRRHRTTFALPPVGVPPPMTTEPDREYRLLVSPPAGASASGRHVKRFPKDRDLIIFVEGVDLPDSALISLHRNDLREGRSSPASPPSSSWSAIRWRPSTAWRPSRANSGMAAEPHPRGPRSTAATVELLSRADGSPGPYHLDCSEWTREVGRRYAARRVRGGSKGTLARRLYAPGAASAPEPDRVVRLRLPGSKRQGPAG
jgi:hypothetical protein